MVNYLIMTLLFLTSSFLILLVLVQRGRGGGLAGAFGGLGGQSAFGTKAGDLFTRITIVVAAFWIILCAASVKVLSDSSRSVLSPTLGKNATSGPGATGGAEPSGQPGATGESKASDTKAAPAGSEKAASGEAPAGPALTPPAQGEQPAAPSSTPPAEAPK